MESISVYGYNHDLLDLVATSPKVQRQNDLFAEIRSYHKLSEGGIACPLLDLPFEIRVNIYSYLLPATVELAGKGVLWRRGNITILSVNKQIYDEATKIMYGNATFVIDVAWDGITFAYQWLLSTGLVPKTRLAFPKSFAWRNLGLVRKVMIRIHQVDSYTGMMKYNYAGRNPLTAGLKDQVETLCTSLQKMAQLRQLHIHLQNNDYDPLATGTIMDPFSRLSDRLNIRLSGNLNSDVWQRSQAQ